jgi:hypothetical protein
MIELEVRIYKEERERGRETVNNVKSESKNSEMHFLLIFRKEFFEFLHE